jgi:hypothetical protein
MTDSRHLSAQASSVVSIQDYYYNWTNRKFLTFTRLVSSLLQPSKVPDQSLKGRVSTKTLLRAGANVIKLFTSVIYKIL